MRACLAALLLIAPFAARADIFDEGAIEARGFRNPAMAREAMRLGVETESLFGFVLGSDVDGAGSRGAAVELQGGFGRRDGRYGAVGGKLEFSYGARGDLALSLSLLGGWRGIAGVTGMTDTRAARFDGVGTELRWRLLDRQVAPVGVTLHIEPSLRWRDEAGGEAGFGIASENKLIIDRELVEGRLYGALNLIWDVERFRPQGGPTERGSTIGLGGAMTWQAMKGLFVGGEVRYLRAYEGLAPERFLGQALFAGPTLFWSPRHGVFVSATVQAQLAGREAGGGLDLANFTRIQARLKAGMEF